jgi:hypothetical protein
MKHEIITVTHRGGRSATSTEGNRTKVRVVVTTGFNEPADVFCIEMVHRTSKQPDHHILELKFKSGLEWHGTFDELRQALVNGLVQNLH